MSHNISLPDLELLLTHCAGQI